MTPSSTNALETKTLAFPAVSTQEIRVNFAGGNVDGWSYMEEIQAFYETEEPFYKIGTDVIEDFSAVTSNHAFDVKNNSTSFLMLKFEATSDATFSPALVRLAPGARTTVQMTLSSGVASATFSYDIASSRSNLGATSHRYRAYSHGETVMAVPVPAELHGVMERRTTSILQGSKALVTDARMPSGSYIYTPGPYYLSAGLFARDFLYQLEGSAGFGVTAEEVRRAVDLLALNQLGVNRAVGGFTYPKGAIPDHVYADGRYAWGPGLVYGDDPRSFNRPSMDEAFCFVTLAWHFGYKSNWDAAWVAWFDANSTRFIDAWNSVPRNPQNGLVTQWTTIGHIGANNIAERTGPSVMWGFHDSYGFGGDDIGTSILACNAARALADMFENASDLRSAATWTAIADAMRDAVRAQFNPVGYLPWGLGESAATMASPDYTGYAVWSGILTDAQADAASDWLAGHYRSDKALGGFANLFNMSPGYRGAVRMASKTDDSYPGSHVWPHLLSPYWENLTYGYNAYQDGGYWYYKSDGIALALWRKHPNEAKEWVNDTYSDIVSGGDDYPFERVDWSGPVNSRYNASIGPVMGMGMPAVTRVKSIARR